MTHDPREALEPCPFCGEEDISFNPPDKERGWKGSINCPSCLATMPREVNDDQELIDCWNTRVLTASASGEQQPVAWQFQAVNGKWSICGTPDEGDFAAYPERLRPLYTSAPPATGWDEATTYRVDYDGFVGTKIGTYRTREGREGVVLQQVDTKIVHVYGANRVERNGFARTSDGGFTKALIAGRSALAQSEDARKKESD